MVLAAELVGGGWKHRRLSGLLGYFMRASYACVRVRLPMQVSWRVLGRELDPAL